MLRVDTERRFLPRFKNWDLAPSNVSTGFLSNNRVDGIEGGAPPSSVVNHKFLDVFIHSLKLELNHFVAATFRLRFPEAFNIEISQAKAATIKIL